MTHGRTKRMLLQDAMNFEHRGGRSTALNHVAAKKLLLSEAKSARTMIRRHLGVWEVC